METTAGLSFACPPVGAVVAVTGIVIGGALLLEAANQAPPVRRSPSPRPTFDQPSVDWEAVIYSIGKNKLRELGKYKSVYKMDQWVKNDNHTEIVAVHKAHQPRKPTGVHAHFDNGAALYKDGVWRHGPEFIPTAKSAAVLYLWGWERVPGYSGFSHAACKAIVEAI